jgi:poly-gamma-glutamate capsule biosynthesis protein CapA/YwtB (metallophosphatase superfamily)
MSDSSDGHMSQTLIFFGAMVLCSLAMISPAASQSVDSTKIVLRFAGDVLLGGHYERAAGADVGMAFHGFTLFRNSDVAVVNLENPVTTRGAKIPKTFNFRMHPRFLRAIKDAGISAVSLANNHVFDYGREGLEDTFRWLDSAGISYVGAGRNSASAHVPFTFCRGGQTVAVFGYYGGREAPGAGRNSGGVARRELPLITRDIRLAREAGATYIVVILHWGTEKAEIPDASQRLFAHSLIDAGVDAVIGHHSHVLQGVERYRSGIIVYSLGNFVFGGNSRSTYETGVFEITLSGRVPAYRLIPVGVRNWHLVELTGGDSLRVWQRVQRLSRVFPNTIP